MKYGIDIREADERDISAMVELWKEFIDFHAESEPFFTRTDTGPETIRQLLIERIFCKKSCVLVAEQNDKIVAYLQVEISSYPEVYRTHKYGCVSSLAVTGQFRRSGIGEQLFNEARRWFVNQGVHRIEVPVAVSNEMARAFWKKVGFRPYVEIFCTEV